MLNQQLSFTQPPQLSVAVSPSGTAHGGVTGVTAGQDCSHPNVCPTPMCCPQAVVPAATPTAMPTPVFGSQQAHVFC